MSVFKTESELMGAAVVRPVSKRAKQWAEQAVFIEQLVMNEGKYAMWPKTYATLNNHGRCENHATSDDARVQGE